MVPTTTVDGSHVPGTHTPCVDKLLEFSLGLVMVCTPTSPHHPPNHTLTHLHTHTRQHSHTQIHTLTHTPTNPHTRHTLTHRHTDKPTHKHTHTHTHTDTHTPHSHTYTQTPARLAACGTMMTSGVIVRCVAPYMMGCRETFPQQIPGSFVKTEMPRVCACMHVCAC